MMNLLDCTFLSILAAKDHISHLISDHCSERYQSDVQLPGFSLAVKLKETLRFHLVKMI